MMKSQEGPVDMESNDRSIDSLPVVAQADAEQDAHVECKAAPNEGEARSRILIVDDTQDMVKLVKMYLEHHHYEVITAGDGQEGLDKAKTENPDLIVLDLMLPKMNGYKVCGLLKNDRRYANIPIMLFSAKAQDKDVQLGEQVGADAYLTKPFEPETLLSKIEELIKG